MAKTVDRSIKNGASSICFFVKWLLLLWVTFQACKSSIFPPQHRTLESSTLWAFSLVVRCRTQRKKRPDQRKNTQNITKAEGSSCPVAIIKVHVPWRSIIIENLTKIDQTNNIQVAHVVLVFDRVTTGHPRLMEMPADNFFASVRLPVKGF